MPKLVSLPPLGGVKDAAVRAALEAIYQELQLRRGERGDGTSRFITKNELDSQVADAVAKAKA